MDDSALQSLGTGPLSGDDKKLLGLTTPPKRRGAYRLRQGLRQTKKRSKPGRVAPLEFVYTFLKVVNILLTLYLRLERILVP